MLPASNRGAGGNVGFPDVCNTPIAGAPVPVPYVNMALNAQAMPFSPTVKVSMMNALNLASKIPMTSGDEAGVLGPMIKQMGGYTGGDVVVSIDGLPAIRQAVPTYGNGMNNAVGIAAIPSAVNVMFCYAGETPRAIGADEVGSLGQAIGGAGGDAAPVGPGSMIGERVGHVAVTLFTLDLPTRLYNVIARLERQGMRGLVLDLRGCPGGDAHAALRAAGDFVDDGVALARIVDADGDERVLRARGACSHRFPVAVLVDRATASAAELFVAALQSHGRAVVVGARTHGKGTAQAVVSTSLGAGPEYATIARFRRPGGEELEGAGVEPDVRVPEGRDALAEAIAALGVV